MPEEIAHGVRHVLVRAAAAIIIIIATTTTGAQLTEIVATAREELAVGRDDRRVEVAARHVDHVLGREALHRGRLGHRERRAMAELSATVEPDCEERPRCCVCVCGHISTR